MAERDPHRIHGIETDEALEKRRWLRQDLTAGEELHRLFVENDLTPVFFLLAVMGSFLIPGPWEVYCVLTLIYGALIRSHYKKYPSMPHLLPHDAPVDYDIRLPKDGTGRRKYEEPSGEVYVGNERRTGKQVWFRFKDFLRHGIVYGGTGSGKTEFLLCLAFNFMAAGGSLLWADAKAGANTPHKISWMCHRFGREDDMLFVNFIKPEGKDPTKLVHQTTHTINPCTEGSENEIATMGRSLMPDMGEGGGSNQSFADNAQVLINSLTAALVDLRDSGHIALSWDVFRDHVQLPKVLELAEDKRLSTKARDKIRRFAYGIAGVDPSKGPSEQEQMAFQQFGFIASYTLSGLAKLTDDYDYIYGARYGDVSYRDAVFRGRCVASFIPAMKNTPEEIKMLGKLDLVGKRAALAEGLPSQLEGTGRSAYKEEIYNGKIVPSLSVTDEYQEIQVEGNSVTVKQGRSLGFAVLVGLQNYSGLGSEEETNNYDENTDIKMLGRNQGSETVEAISKSLSKAMVAQSEGRTTEDSMLGQREKRTVAYHERDVIEKADVTSQRVGEFHLTYEGRVMRIETPYITSIFDRKDWDFPEQAAVILNTFIELEPITAAEIVSHDMATTVYSEFIAGRRAIKTQLNSGNRRAAEVLGHKAVSFDAVIESIMIDGAGVEGESEWLKSTMAPLPAQSPAEMAATSSTPNSSQSAPTTHALHQSNDFDGMFAELDAQRSKGSETSGFTQAAALAGQQRAAEIAKQAGSPGVGSVKPQTGQSDQHSRDVVGVEGATKQRGLNWDRTEQQRLRKDIVEQESRDQTATQFSLFSDQESAAKEQAEQVAAFSKKISDTDAISYTRSDDDFEKILIAADDAFWYAAQTMGLEPKDVDPKIMNDIRDILEARLSKPPVDQRDAMVATGLRNLGIYDD